MHPNPTGFISVSPIFLFFISTFPSKLVCTKSHFLFWFFLSHIPSRGVKLLFPLVRRLHYYGRGMYKSTYIVAHRNIGQPGTGGGKLQHHTLSWNTPCGHRLTLVVTQTRLVATTPCGHLDSDQLKVVSLRLSILAIF